MKTPAAVWCSLLALAANMPTALSVMATMRYYFPSDGANGSLSGIADGSCEGEPIALLEYFAFPESFVEGLSSSSSFGGGSSGESSSGSDSGSSRGISGGNSSESSIGSSGGNSSESITGTSSGGNSITSSGDDTQFPFGQCNDEIIATCDNGTLIIDQYAPASTDTSCSGTVQNSTSLSHDMCVGLITSIGCSETDSSYESTTSDDFTVTATYYSDHTCDTTTGTSEVVVSEDVTGYIEATMTELTTVFLPALFTSVQSTVGAATATPPVNGFATTTESVSDCSVLDDDDGTGIGSAKAICVSGAVKIVVYNGTEGCEGAPLMMQSFPGCVYTGTVDTYALLSCAEDDETSGVVPNALPIPLIMAASAAASGFLASIGAFY